MMKIFDTFFTALMIGFEPILKIVAHVQERGVSRRKSAVRHTHSGG